MALRERFEALPADSPAAGLRLRDGSLRDYKRLAAFHYLRHQPVTATRVLVLEHVDQSPADRFAQRKASARVVGVLVESLPALSCALRDVALGGRYTGWSDRRAAARLLNAEVRCISRVVVHPQWRGLGLAVRLVRHALATMSTRYTEALAAMGKVHPFFRLAGMREYRRWPHARDQRLRDALACVGLEPWELASAERVRVWLAGAGQRGGLLRDELGRWAGRRLALDEQLGKATGELLSEPMYYVRARNELEDPRVSRGSTRGLG